MVELRVFVKHMPRCFYLLSSRTALGDRIMVQMEGSVTSSGQKMLSY